MGAPLTWGKIGSLSGLNILDCYAREFPNAAQINVFYRVADMRFAEPMEPLRAHFFGTFDTIPLHTHFNYKDFRRCEVQLVINTKFPFEIDAQREREFATHLFRVWAMQSGYDNWVDERRHKGLEPCDIMRGGYPSEYARRW